MIEEFITPSRIANTIFQKSKFKGTYLIVEGDNDYKLYKKFVNDQFCQVEIAFGYANVIEVINELNNRGFQFAIGLIDADFRVLDNDIPADPCVFITDEHDLELMIFKSDAFETVIEQYAKPDKLLNLIKENGNKTLRDIFLNLALPLGYLKWANKKNSFGMVFKPSTQDGNPLSISDFIPTNTLIFSVHDKMIDTVLNYSRGKSEINTTKENAINKLEELFQYNPDIYQLCNGHDVMNIICISLKKKLSNMNANALKPEQLEKEMILAFDSRHFELTGLYTKIKNWEKLKGMQVLKF